MQKVVFPNPNRKTFFNLSKIGLINFYDPDDENTIKYKGKNLDQLCIKGISEKASFGDYELRKLDPQENLTENFDFKNHVWKTAEIYLSEQAIGKLKESTIKDYKLTS